jgi:hypothetical protein
MKPLPSNLYPGTYGSGMFPEGPIHSVEDAMPADIWRVRIFYADGSHEHATCDAGRWWTYLGEVFPTHWQTMGDRRMVAA